MSSVGISHRTPGYHHDRSAARGPGYVEIGHEKSLTRQPVGAASDLSIQLYFGLGLS
ncbi:hypothetical protein E143388_00561 [Rhodococcus opacus]|nr:hypothetical protein E143388_00561 [Rhodococcus opacus]